MQGDRTTRTELLREISVPLASAPAGEIKVFRYPVCPGTPPAAWNGWLEVAVDGAEGKLVQPGPLCRHEPADDTELPAKLAEETTRSFEAGRERGREESREMERAAQAATMKNAEEGRKQELAKLVGDFSAERDRFLGAVEHEVVKLALAVAARILRREAQMDPLLLTGAVRVALGQLAGATEVHLRVPAAEMDLWKEAIALVPNLTLKPAVVAGEGMRLGDCVIESKVGTVDLGVRSQLGEIERGFFDRASAGPQETSDMQMAEHKKGLA
jgi:flagellar biosynthesis/type III secretory pathway protein FliH